MGHGWRAGALSLALTVVLSGCGLIGIDHPIGGGPPGGAAKAGGPPPGGWPQPENGRFTKKMCGLLTEADYAKFGHQRLPADAEGRPVPGSANSVSCAWIAADQLVLNLQPTADAAKLIFAAGLRQHQRRMAQEGVRPVLATSVVPGADESWFDYWTYVSAGSKRPEHELQLRRGSLIVGLTLSGLRGKNEKEPREVLAGLAALVLQRIPEVGKKDTGVTHKLRFEVLGKGRAQSVSFYDPTRGQTIRRKNVRLPWHSTTPLVTTQPQVLLNLTAVAPTPFARIGCRISVDGKQLEEQAPTVTGLTNCTATYSQPG